MNSYQTQRGFAKQNIAVVKTVRKTVKKSVGN